MEDRVKNNPLSLEDFSKILENKKAQVMVAISRNVCIYFKQTSYGGCSVTVRLFNDNAYVILEAQYPNTPSIYFVYTHIYKPLYDLYINHNEGE